MFQLIVLNIPQFHISFCPTYNNPTITIFKYVLILRRRYMILSEQFVIVYFGRKLKWKETVISNNVSTFNHAKTGDKYRVAASTTLWAVQSRRQWMLFVWKNSNCAVLYAPFYSMDCQYQMLSLYFCSEFLSIFISFYQFS